MVALPFTFDPKAAIAPTAHNGNLQSLPSALAPLIAQRRWIVWRWYFLTDTNKWTKVPYQSSRLSEKARTNAPYTWSDHATAARVVETGEANGIGYMLKDTEIAALDLDDCRNTETGEIAQWASDLVAEADSYAEITVSGSGLRIIGHATGEHVHRNQNLPGTVSHIESYRRATRYIVVTGLQLEGTGELKNIDGVIDRLVARLDAEKQEPAPPPRPHYKVERRDVLPAELENLIRQGVPIKYRSEQFHHAVGWLKDLGWSAEEIERELSAHPDGIASKYKRRLSTEIARCFGKAREPAQRYDRSRPYHPIAGQGQRVSAAPEAPSVIPDLEPRPPALDTSTLDDFCFEGDAYDPASMPGLLGAISSHILSTALFPVSDFACLSSLVLCSAIFGRRWTEPIMGGGLNIYAIATAPTGWGKDHPLHEPRNLAYRSGLMHLMGPGEFKSDSAIEKTLRKCPVRACYMDEIGIVLQANASRNASSWERRVRKALLEVYSASKSMWTGSQAAGDKDEKDKGSEPLHRPLLSIYGTSTPEELYRGLSDDNIRDGLFGRLIFAAPEEKPKRQRPGKGLYEDVETLIEQIRDFTPSGIADKQRALYHSNLRNAMMPPMLIQVAIDDEARGALECIEEWQRDLTEHEGGLSRIANRAAENVGKLSTIRALSRDHEHPQISLQDAKWAWSIVRRSLYVIARDIEQHMVGSEFEGLVKTILRVLREARREGVAMSKLYQRHGIAKFHSRDKEAAMRQLETTGDIVRKPTGNRGFRYWLSEFADGDS